MAVVTSGIIFADLFINSKSDFVKYFTTYFEQNAASIDTAIQELENVLNSIQTKSLDKAHAEAFHRAWKNFQQVVLLNTKDLELIVGYRAPCTTNVQFSNVINMSDVTENTNLIKTGSDAVRQAMKWAEQSEKAQKAEKALQSHLNGFINTLYSKLSESEKDILIKQNFNAIPNRWKKHHLGTILDGKRWQEVFYEQYYAGQGLGKAYDAYMNHVANHHTALYNYLASGGTSNTGDIPNMRHSVYTEEGGAGGHFPILLNESLNTTGWYTGGDIVIVDPQTMEVVYNIQLKTTQDGVTKKGKEKTPKNFDIAIAKLKVFINGGTIKVGNNVSTFGPLSKLPANEKAERLFDLLQTSVSNYGAFNNAVQETINDIVQKGISEKAQKINIILKF